jgi:UDP-glucose 4-epimerase
MALELCDLPLEGVNFEFTGGDRGWKGDVPVVRFDCSKIENLGWRCSRTSGDALRNSMNAMREEILHA